MQTDWVWTRGLWTTSLTWETVPIIEHICTKLWFNYNDDLKKPLLSPYSMDLDMNIFEFSLTKELFEQSLVEIIPVVLEKKLKTFVTIFSLFSYYFSLQKRRDASFEYTLIYLIYIFLVLLEKIYENVKS